MQLRRLVLEDFRNIRRADLVFRGGRQFLAGANGQGKTNLLEAAGLLTALRSFRTPDARLLPRTGCGEASVAWEVDHGRLGEIRVVLRLRAAGKELNWGNERIVRLADHLGTFPTVVCSSQDLALVRSGPADRRRWLDLVLAAMDRDYFKALQDYMRALAGRNALLKRERMGPGAGGGGAAFGAFERVMARAGALLVERRVAGSAELSLRLTEAYARLTGGREKARMGYEPSATGDSESLRVRLEAGRGRDLAAGVTLGGPHRDDLGFHVGGADARSFASEGQQRSVVLALRLAQAFWFEGRSGERPVVLADDVLGELDPDRRRCFWEALDPAWQVIATGTEPPRHEPGAWQVFQVDGGEFRENPAAQ